jgi:transposase-like protein
LSSSLEATDSTLNAAGGRRSRRSWSDEDKQRIVGEAVIPGASVADIARRHGVNANLVFNWRKAARAAAAKVSASDACAQGDARPGAAEACEFIPIRVSGRAEDGAAALIRIDQPALSRTRLSWVSRNFIRPETIAAANARIVAAQNALPIAQIWGTGEVASADGIRFVAPSNAIHAGPNPKYFGAGRGITYYDLLVMGRLCN